jgi:hypothetical protein
MLGLPVTQFTWLRAILGLLSAWAAVITWQWPHSLAIASENIVYLLLLLSQWKQFFLIWGIKAWHSLWCTFCWFWHFLIRFCLLCFLIKGEFLCSLQGFCPGGLSSLLCSPHLMNFSNSF